MNNNISILDKILEQVHFRLNERKKIVSEKEIIDRAFSRKDINDFKKSISKPGLNLIAEIKRASPSKGNINLNLNPTILAKQYEKAGASAISVLTEEDFFKGSLNDLKDVRNSCHLPILRKDFIIDKYQIWESRAYGADAILLIVSILPEKTLHHLFSEAKSAELSVLIEVHNETDLEKALKLNPSIIGINNRNLNDFSVSLNTTKKIAELIPTGITVVSESGIRSNEDLQYLKNFGVNGVLIGESLASSAYPEKTIRELLDI